MHHTKNFVLWIAFLLSICLYAQKGIKIKLGDKTDIGYTGKGVLPNTGVNDPHVHIFNNRAYLFASHDTIIGKRNKTYMMPNWNIYSSADLVHWEKEFVLYPKDTYIGKKIDKCFATDGATRNGKYYFYFSNFSTNTGVAISDKPGGPYVDTGKPIITAENTPSNNRKHDPTIFVDDDGKNYIMWGNTGWNNAYYQIAELNEDMTSLKTKARDMVITDNTKIKHDGGYLHKHNDTYYLSAHHGKYATSKNLFGPYKFRGAVEAHGDHGTYFTWHNQTYYIAGGWAKPYFRYTYLTYAHYKDNGEIVAERVFNGDKEEQGVARYNCSMGAIEAENFFAASDELVKKESNTGFEMRNIQNNSYLFFPKLYNALRKATIEFKVASAHKKGGIIEVRQGSTKGKLLATCKIKSTGSWDNYQTFSCDLKNKSSLLDLYFVFKGDSSKEIMRLDSFSVSAKPMVYKPTLTFNDTNNYTFKTFTTDDTLTITCKYHAGTGNKVKGTGVEFFLREFSNRKVVKTHKLSDASTINTQTGIAKVHFNLTEVTPSKELNSRNKYQLMAVLKTSNGKTISQGLRAEIEVVKK